MTHFHIYGIGAALVDTEIEVSEKDLLDLNVEKGLMTLVDEDRQHFLMDRLANHLVASKRASGGSAANSVIAASYFGANSFYSCRFADDDNGQFYRQDMLDAGVSLPEDSGSAPGITGKCLVMITPDAERTMNTYLGISETISTKELHEPAIKASEYIYIEGYLVTSTTGRAAAIELRRLAQQHGVKTSLSLSDPAIAEHFRDGLLEILGGERLDFIFCNQEEAIRFTKTSSLEEAKSCLRDYASQYAITLGSQGAWVYDGQREHKIESLPVKAIDTNGAGDMFAGAFLYALTHGHDHATAGKLASAASAQVVSQFGPRLKPHQHQNILEQILGRSR